MNRKSHIATFAFVVLLAWAPWFVSAAYTAVWQWSTTASSNASVDPAINWREGQPPSSVNDSARAMMAALASYRDDISGLLTTGGTSTAYTVTTNQNVCAAPSTVPQDGQQLALTISATNGAAATLQADACNIYPIQSAPAVAVAAASLIQGSPYTVRFSTANSAWMLRDFYGSALTVPLGGMIPYTGTTVPNSNFVFPAGQCLSTTTYASYWVLLGSPASGACSGGFFQIVDMRGRVPAGLDNLSPSGAANRLTSSATGCGTAMTSVGAACANGVEGSAISLAQLPTGITSITPGVISVNANTSNKNFATTAGNIAGVQTGGGTQAASSTTTAGGNGDYQTASSMATAGQVTVTSNNTSGTARPGIQPTVAVTYLLRVI